MIHENCEMKEDLVELKSGLWRLLILSITAMVGLLAHASHGSGLPIEMRRTRSHSSADGCHVVQKTTATRACPTWSASAPRSSAPRDWRVRHSVTSSRFA